MVNNKIDHFAIGAANLDQGVDFVQSRCDAIIPQGGKHDAMSTHNCVARAGNDSFLEIIAVDPAAPDPGRVRWFTLDDPVTQSRLRVSPVALCWVVGTDDLDAIVADSPVDLGEVVTFTRGDRSWRLTVPNDGSLPRGGLLPAFIEWSPGPHPSSGMRDVGVTLQSVNISHPDPVGFTLTLDALQITHLVNLRQSDSPALGFSLNTANGVVDIV